MIANEGASTPTDMSEQTKILISLQEPTSGRWAVLEDNGESAWLYVTKPDTETVKTDCFIYNRIPPISKDDLSQYVGGPPPVTDNFASNIAFIQEITADDIALQWSADGQTAIAIIHRQPWAKIHVGEKQGYSRGLCNEGPYGKPWNE